jgi:hypothetical protein
VTAASVASICFLCIAIVVNRIVAKTEGHIRLSLDTREKRWENVTLDKMKVLVASLINMNLIEVQQLHLAGTQVNHITRCMHKFFPVFW